MKLRKIKPGLQQFSLKYRTLGKIMNKTLELIWLLNHSALISFCNERQGQSPQSATNHTATVK